MKNLFSLAALTFLLLAVACSGVDKELVGKMQNDLSTLEGLAPAFETLGKNIENLATQINAAPEAMKSESNTAYQELLTMNGRMSQKFQATAAEYNDLTGKLKGLVADYSAGKIKTEDAQKEYETLSVAVQGFSTLVGQMTQVGEQLQTDYAKMSATWNANAEEAAQ
jgi:hypothetical protein